MGKPIKVRARIKGDIADVKVLMEHPMETGARVDADTGEPVPRHYIKEVVCKHNGSVVHRAYWGTAVSKNPYWSFKFKGGKKGDKIKISWTDNTGETASEEVEIK